MLPETLSMVLNVSKQRRWQSYCSRSAHVLQAVVIYCIFLALEFVSFLRALRHHEKFADKKCRLPVSPFLFFLLHSYSRGGLCRLRFSPVEESFSYRQL